MQDSLSTRNQDPRERDKANSYKISLSQYVLYWLIRYCSWLYIVRKAVAKHSELIISKTGDQKIKASMFCCNLSLGRRLKVINKRLAAMLILLLAVLVGLHLIILPSASGGYNDECYLTDVKRQKLRIMVKNISRAFDKFGVQYWLDYGKLFNRIVILRPCSLVNVST